MEIYELVFYQRAQWKTKVEKLKSSTENTRTAEFPFFSVSLPVKTKVCLRKQNAEGKNTDKQQLLLSGSVFFFLFDLRHKTFRLFIFFGKFLLKASC